MGEVLSKNLKSIERLSLSSQRLKENDQWYALPALLGFWLVLVLAIFLLPELNPRLGSLSSPLVFATDKQASFNSLRLELTLVSGKVRVVTSDRFAFEWLADSENSRGSEEFQNYFKEKSKQIIHKAALAKGIALDEFSVLISADQGLRYYHVRPVLFALSENGFSRYGFETLIPSSDLSNELVQESPSSSQDSEKEIHDNGIGPSADKQKPSDHHLEGH